MGHLLRCQSDATAIRKFLSLDRSLTSSEVQEVISNAEEHPTQAAMLPFKKCGPRSRLQCSSFAISVGMPESLVITAPRTRCLQGK